MPIGQEIKVGFYTGIGVILALFIGGFALRVIGKGLGGG